MSDLLTPDTPTALDRAKARVAGDLAAHCRVMADNLAYAITMAEARGDGSAEALHVRMAALLDAEQAMARRGGSPTAHVRYEPGFQSARVGEEG
jgi:hypothetical protein